MAKYKNTTKFIYTYKYSTNLFNKITECLAFCVQANYSSKCREE